MEMFEAAGGVQRVLKVFERNYRLRSADFYRAHLRNEAPAAEVAPWHREIWSGAYRQWLRDRGALDETWSMRAPGATPSPEQIRSRSIASPSLEARG